MNISREAALKLLNIYVESDSLRKHSLAVEAAMAEYAKHFGEDETKWRITGLLHDFDYEKWPNEHPQKGSEILREHGYPQEVIVAILGHSERSGVPRETTLAKTLFACDELCGMVMATAYVRPQKLEGMTANSVRKNLKKKGFAAAINRQDIAKGVLELGVDEDEHINRVINALRSAASNLGF